MHNYDKLRDYKKRKSQMRKKSRFLHVVRDYTKEFRSIEEDDMYRVKRRATICRDDPTWKRAKD